ncbi:MAG: PIN/TRAM domain-containing protein [Brevinemataceae bacterium]
MLETWMKHRFAIFIFLMAGIVHYFFGGRSPWVILASLITIFFTILFERLFYEKRGIYIFAQIGFITGYFSGVLAWKFIQMIYPVEIPINLEPYFIACFGYLGYYMPLMSVYQPGGIFQMPYNVNSSLQSALDYKLLDTSVIIDGRINDIISTGFISGHIILPKFVLNELQALADSQDSIKRSRARRGLDVLNLLREQKNITLKVTSKDYPQIKGVDSKLISLAKEKSYCIFTNDYNLNKIAKIEGVEVLNINDLSNALKPVLLPGEEMELEVIKEGKEPGQGIGYMPDGTMVVVAQGSHLVGRKLNVKVTSILQTSAGRIIFTAADE